LNEENESSGSIKVYKEEEITFLDKGKTLNLTKLAKSLAKFEDEAIQTLVKLLTDEKAEPKIKLAAATALLELQVKVKKEISADTISRLIAEVKLNPTRRKQLTGADDETPLVDFGTVQKIGWQPRKRVVRFSRKLSVARFKSSVMTISQVLVTHRANGQPKPP